MTDSPRAPEARLFDARACTLGEGPLWHPLRRQFFWFDIIGKRLLSRENDRPHVWQFDEHASAAGWVDADTLLIATETGLRRFDIRSGAHEEILPLEAGNPVTRSNDGRADRQGGFWIGTMGKNAEPGAGAIYRFHDGALECLHRDITVSNAICFAPDGRTAYFSDTRTHRILRQELDAQGWPSAPAEAFIDLTEEPLNPDGAVIDAEGGLWNAQWGAGRVARYRPDGSFDRAIAVPGRNTSCPAFGGPDLSQILVTTAREALAAPGEADGRTYLIEAPGVCGLPEPQVRL
ncbi:MAG: SMP-30/gluconolactonase/LRE family protein [Rhodobacteraceae bacterium]|nr:SMP-30/gluconolactonase/LRE family protein [Paracoccaceae bacterium]